MILLDTDHVSLLRIPNSQRGNILAARLMQSGEMIGIPVVAAEETMRGWLAAVAKVRLAIRQVYAYRELGSMFTFFADFPILPFDEDAARRFDTFSKIRIGVSDRKIAAISLTQNATLLTANRRDFEQIPGLRFENWLD